MSQTYTYSSLSSRVKRQTDGELSLFKMATICGYPGAATRWLPFIHSSFPASPTIPPPKCYTFSPRRERTSMSKSKNKSRADDSSKAVVCYEGRDVIQLPEIVQSPDEYRSSPHGDNGYVNKNKVCFKLKGINPKQVYSTNRSKPNITTNYRHSLECLRINPHRSASLVDFNADDSWNLALESIAKATLKGTSSGQERDWELEEFREASPITLARKKQMEDERRYARSSMKGKKFKESRSLGHTVSPRRMNIILQEKGKTFPYTCYKTDTGHGS